MRFVSIVIACLTSAVLLAGLSARGQVLQDGAPSVQQRKALLVCIDDYSAKDDPDIQNDKLAVFLDLSSPCKDAELLDLKLQQVGWKPEDIRTLKNPTFQQLSGELFGFTAALNGGISDKQPLGFIYIASHAVTVDHSPYVLLPNAKLNIAKARDRYVVNPLNPTLFGDQALSLDYFYFKPVGENCACEIILVLDACRESAFGGIQQLNEGLGGASVGLPTFWDGRPDGLGVLFATKAGGVVFDDSTTVIVEALRASMGRDKKVTDVFWDAVDNGRAISKQRQKAIQPDFVYKPNRTGREMLFAESAKSSATKTPIAAPISLRPVSKPDASFQPIPIKWMPAPVPQGPGRKQVPDEIESPPVVLWTPPPATTADQFLIDVDVFWCEGVNAAANKKKAEDFAGFATSLAVRGIEEAGSRLGRIRLRPLSEAINAEVGYRFNTDLSRPEANRPEELAWAKRISADVGPRAAAKPVPITAFSSPGYFTAAFCAGAKLPPTSLERVWFHVARSDQQPTAADMVRSLSAKFTELDVNQGVVLVAEAPNKSQVRYFYEQDEKLASLIAQQIKTESGIEMRLNRIKDPAFANIPPGLVEVWYGKGEGPIKLSVGCSTKATNANGERQSCRNTRTVVPTSGFVFGKVEGQVLAQNGSETSCTTLSASPNEVVVEVRARSPKGLASGRGWAQCEFVIPQTPKS